MSEITCSQCGAQNPTQSKYCNRCGNSFVNVTTHICSTCNTPNPINLLYCDNCGTRLVDDTSSNIEGDDVDADNARGSRSQPFSLPTRPPGQTGSLDVSADLPDWLKTGDFSGDHAQDGINDEDLQWLRAAQEGDDWADDDAPTLEELSSDHAPQDDLPTWLLDEDTDGAIFGGGKSTDELFMGFSSVDEGVPEETSEAAQPADDLEAASELQSWLSEMEGSDPEQAETDFDAATRPPAPEPDEPLTALANASPEMEEDDFLQWLSEIQQESATDEDDVPASAADDPMARPDLPGWLDQPEKDALSRGEESSGTAPDDTDAPEWLVDLADEGHSHSADDSFDAAEAGIEAPGPDWLFEPSVEDGGADVPREDTVAHGDAKFTDGFVAESEAAGVGATSGTVSADDKPEDDFLQWLDSLDTGQDVSQAASQSDAPVDLPEGTDASSQLPGSEFSEADFALPEWLGDLAKPADLTEQQDSAALGELPAWLRDITSPGESVTLPYVSGTEPEANDAMQQGDVPAELSETAKPELAEAELPDWITGVSAELSISGEGHVDEDQPDQFESSWSLDQAEGQPQESVSVEPGDQQVTKEDLPEWFSDVLADIETADERQPSTYKASELANVPEQLAGAELPDWLDSPFVDEAAAEPTPLEEIPEWLRAPLKEKLARTAEEHGLDESTLDGGEEWRELLEAPISSEESSESRVHDPVPAWLESLRSSASLGSGDNEEADKGDTSGKGSPIAGIPGAIGIAPVVAQSARRERPLADAISKEQEQQILLLRQLARTETDERSVALSTSAVTSHLPALTRVLLALLLLVTVVLGLVASTFWPDLVLPAANSGPQPLMQTVLDEVAGQPVLLVFDYTPAMAGALDPLAENVLTRLQAQGSQTLVTSQSASGLALASRAVSRSGITGAADLGFIPGGALGVRRLGNCIEAGDSCQSLFGQAIDDEAARQLAAATAVVVITADRDSLLAWIEQLDTINSISLGAIITPGLQPVAGPYLATGQLAQIAVADGLATTGQASSAVTALGLSQLFIVAAMIAGAAFYLLEGLVRRRRA